VAFASFVEFVCFVEFVNFAEFASFVEIVNFVSGAHADDGRGVPTALVRGTVDQHREWGVFGTVKFEVAVRSGGGE
jgi:hypothetical protein